MEWRSIDGIRLRGTLLLPAGYKEGQRYSMIVFPYPNDRRSDFVNRFGVLRAGTDNMQLFATRGYVVLLPDNVIREGSTLRDLGKSIMPGVDKIVEMGIADNDRIGLMGHSWGGYAVLSLIVQTTRFKAAGYAGEVHSEDLWGYPNQLDYLNRVIGWYDTYLKAPSAASKN